jgi:hypothetical protein
MTAGAGAEVAPVVAGTFVVDVVVVEVVDVGLVAAVSGAAVEAGVLEPGADELGADAEGAGGCERPSVWVLPLHPLSVNSGSEIETAVRSQ